jgi:hypothetical protein
MKNKVIILSALFLVTGLNIKAAPNEMQVLNDFYAIDILPTPKSIGKETPLKTNLNPVNDLCRKIECTIDNSLNVEEIESALFNIEKTAGEYYQSHLNKHYFPNLFLSVLKKAEKTNNIERRQKLIKTAVLLFGHTPYAVFKVNSSLPMRALMGNPQFNELSVEVAKDMYKLANPTHFWELKYEISENVLTSGFEEAYKTGNFDVIKAIYKNHKNMRGFIDGFLASKEDTEELLAELETIDNNHPSNP